MIEDKATEKLKKRAQDSGLIVNAGADGNEGTIESQTKTTRHLDEHFKHDADEEIADDREGDKK